ncbi:hypothetical protein EB796_009765 [Bugula neritina]|uniref:AMP-binding enzyme C-terminal domain-containing protein n=1 Tax=Bugula neritina TaxID=10212 RepID=A0A7J7K1A7_BUGNE|nr:hypothetical protein EB796_009765 [Bugula neritina]
MVSMDEDGFLYVYGRISNAERWKINGKVVYSISIENVLMTHPSVRTCAVIGTDNGKGHDLNYVIEPAPGSGLTVEDVKKFATENMYNSLEWPIRIFFYKYADIPKTNGSRPKPNRKALTEEIKQRVTQNPSDGLV